jgi:Uma2 family endonuclease
VKAVLPLARRTTYADYLAVEQNSERRHELLDGVIVALPGGSDEHNAIAAHFMGLFMMRVRSGCHAYSSDQRFWIPAATRGRYSDASIICGKPEHPTKRKAVLIGGQDECPLIERIKEDAPS